MSGLAPRKAPSNAIPKTEKRAEADSEFMFRQQQIPPRSFYRG
jgi:hypothetical protein